MPKSDSRDGSALKILICALVAAIVAVLIWMSLGSDVALDEDGYAVTMALYRVCNQRDEEGLESIEDLLAALEADGANTESQKRAIGLIVTDARAGNWEDAMQACRDLLDAQVDS